MGANEAPVIPTRSSVKRLSVRAAPPELAREVGSRMFRRHTLAVLERGARPTLSASAIVRPGITVGVLSYSAPVRIESEVVEDSYQVNIPLRGSFRSMSGEARTVIGVGDAGLYGSRNHGPGSAGVEGWSEPATLIGVKLERERMHDLAARLTGRRVHSLDLPPSLDLRGVAGREWLSLVQILANPLMVHGPSLAQTPWAGDLLEAPIMCGLLELAGLERAVGAAPALAQRASRAGDLQTVLEHIDRFPERAHTVPELAAIGCMSVRSLQLAFRERLGMSPSRYVTGVRLDGAREALRGGGRGGGVGSGGATIAQIAQRWGFGHTGRFAAAYAERFGELPKDTLRRAGR